MKKSIGSQYAFN